MVLIVNNRVVIDPLHLTDETSRLLSAYFLRHRKHGLFLERGKRLFLGLKSIVLTYSILVRHKFEDHWHYDVLTAEAVNKGSVAEIYNVIAVLKESRNVKNNILLTAIRKLNRVYKIQPIDAIKEFSLMKRC